MCSEGYPYAREIVPLFDSKVVVPEVRLKVKSHRGAHYETFVVDTGADVTIIPRSAEKSIKCRLLSGEDLLFGVSGIGIPIQPAEIEIEIIGKFRKVRCALVDDPQVPFLLGRLDILDNFDLLFLEDELQFRARRET